MLSGVSDGAFELLHQRTNFNEQNFYVYQDADSGFNHGFPSNFFAGDNGGVRQDLIEGLTTNLAAIDDVTAATGVTKDPNVLDRQRVTVWQVTIPPLPGFGEFAGVGFEEPAHFDAGQQAVGYDLRGATRVLVDARSPVPGGVDVYFSVSGRNTNRFAPIHLDQNWRTIEINLSTLRNPDTNVVQPPNLANVNELFAVVMTHDIAPNGGTVLLDNVRFDPLPTDPLSGERLSFPVGSETFGVVPAVIHAVDDGDIGFATSGPWSVVSSSAAYQGDQQTAVNSGNTATATWTINDLEPRIYQIQATWTAGLNHATNARFEIFDGAVSRGVTFVDQTVAPVGSEFDGSAWQTIGSLVANDQFISGDEISSGTLRVQLSNAGADGIVTADGIRIVPTIPSDQAIRNLTTTYESALTIISLLARGNATDLEDARLIADALLYALANDNTGGGGGLPTAPDGSRGLRDAYMSGDLATRNSQAGGGATAGQTRLAGFSTDPRLVGESGFALVLDGAFGGNNAFGIMALMSAYSKLGDEKYLVGAEEIAKWIYENLHDPNGPHFPADEAPGDETYGGYFLGYPDQGEVKDRVTSLIRGKSIENNADIFAAFSMIAAAKMSQGETNDAAEWIARANIAGDYVMSLYDPGDPLNNRDGRFYGGTVPVNTPNGPGLTLGGQVKGGEVPNLYTLLDSNTFTTMGLVMSPRYRQAIDWLEPTRYVLDTFSQQIAATTNGQTSLFEGFNIVESTTTSQFRPGGPIGGLPEGIAWEFTAQVVAQMRILDRLFGTNEFESQADFYMEQIRLAQQFAPYGDGMGLVASTLDGENDAANAGYAPIDQALGTPFQAIAERVGLAATNWAIYADQGLNIFAPQLSMPQQIGQQFIVDNWDDDVTRNDVGFNRFSGNTGTTESVEGTTELQLSSDSHGTTGGSLEVSFDFTGSPNESFAGYFTSLFGLTDTLVSLDGSGEEPTMTTQFPGYFLDTQDLFRNFLPLSNRSVEQLQFDVRLESQSDITLKLELRDENGFDVFTRRTLTNSGANWQTVTLDLPASFTDSVEGMGDPSAFDWRKVSLFSIIIERNNVGAGVHNPDTGRFLVDNLRLVDNDGEYANLDAITDPNSGELIHFYEDAYLDYVRGRSAQFFSDWASTDPRTGGIIQDRSTFADLMSLGGVGFQLTAYVVDAERGYMTRDEAASRTLSILRTLYNNPQGPDRIGTIGHEGFFYHFVGIDGLRKQNFDFEETTQLDESLNTVELSSIDTALAVAGVVTSGQFFDSDTQVEAEIRQLAHDIYARVNWNFMLDPNSNQFYLGWKPNENRDDDSGRYGRFKRNDAANEGQYSSKPDAMQNEVPATIDFYTDEGLLLALLAMGSPNPDHRLGREVWDAMLRETAGGSFIRTFPGALFTYQFASVWLDTAALGTDNHQEINGQPALPINFYENTRSATLATIDYAMANPNDRVTWQNGGGDVRWGLTAAEGPFDSYHAHAAPAAALAQDAGITAFETTYLIEAEDGTGDGFIQNRGNASGGMTVHLDSGQTRTTIFDAPFKTDYEISVRYSNNNFGPLETVSVSVDGQFLASFSAEDTGDLGAGWDIFAETGPLRSVTLLPGLHEISVTVSGGDGFGIDVDQISLHHGLVLRPLEEGTSTVYGAGAAILHTPEHAIPALWEANRLGLLDTRFGFADAFNLEINDAVVSETVDDEILRTTGSWVSWAGFGIDHGPMMLMIDNYLSDNFVPGLFMSHRDIRLALATVFPDVNDFPDITAPDVATVPENTTSVMVVTATDLESPPQILTFQVTGGADGALFDINSQTGLLTFKSAPDFDAPADQNADNTYEVEVTVDDGDGGTDQQLISVNVTNVPPQFIFVGPIAEWAKRDPPVPVLPQVVVGGDPTLGFGTLVINLNAVGNRRRSLDELAIPSLSNIGTSNGLQFSNGELRMEIDLRANVTREDIQEFLRNIRFSTRGRGARVDSRTLTATLTDAGGLSTSLTQTISVQRQRRR